MSAIQRRERQPELTRVIEALTESQRREILAALAGAGTTLSETKLATVIVRSEDEQGVDRDLDSARATLRHVHLPKLEALDLVHWDRTAATVALGDNPIHDDPEFQALLRADDERWDLLTAVHADERCRATVEAMAADAGPTTRTELARSLATGDGSRTPEEIAVQLHHVHLPKLASVDLLAYDAADGTVVPSGDLDVPLLDGPASAN